MLSSSTSILFLLGSSLLLLLVSAANAQNDEIAQVARYDNYRLIRVHLDNDEQVAIFQELERVSDSCIFYGHARQVGQRLTILVSAHKIADFNELLVRFSVEHRILNLNFQDAINAQFAAVRPRTVPGYRMQWRNYFHIETINAWMDHLVAQNPNFVYPIDIGASHEGRRLRGVKLSRPLGDGQPRRTAIFIEGGIHAREWISPATSTFIVNQLVNSEDPAMRALTDTFDFYVVPIVNPDGYAFTFDSDRMWRKTRKANGLCVGTDMNRNFESNWNGIGSSEDPCAYDYAGPSALSEPEAAAVARWLRAHRSELRIETFISLHSFSQLMMFPFSHTAERPANYDDLLSMGRKGVEAIARRFGTVYKTGSGYDMIYPSSGGSTNWVYADLNITVAFSIELRGPPDSEVMFNLPAEEIEPVGWETLDGIVALLGEAQRLGYYTVA